jgi:two-component system, chemotaxis family, response regulator Rcp1
MMGKTIDILMVEDDPDDARLTLEAFKDFKVRNVMHIVEDGEAAVEYLKRRGQYSSAARPDLILLDLNLPKKDGRQVLGEIKQDTDLSTIPVVVLTTSDADRDIVESYRLHANCYVQKPVDFTEFMRIVQSIESFWLTVVKLPPE